MSDLHSKKSHLTLRIPLNKHTCTMEVTGIMGWQSQWHSGLNVPPRSLLRSFLKACDYLTHWQLTQLSAITTFISHEHVLCKLQLNHTWLKNKDDARRNKSCDRSTCRLEDRHFRSKLTVHIKPPCVTLMRKQYSHDAYPRNHTGSLQTTQYAFICGNISLAISFTNVCYCAILQNLWHLNPLIL